MKMDRKICLITGANSGIGKAAALQIAQAGHHVIMACRSSSRGEAALYEVRGKSQNGSVELMIVDMSLQASIWKFVADFQRKYKRLDVLIHNAASFDISEKKPVFTAENRETIWATNHLGPVLLTQLLLDSLKQSPQGRVITVASKGLIVFPFLKVNLEDPEFRRRRFTVEKAYYQSKLAQVMYTYWLADQLKDTSITVNCIRVTNVKIEISRYPGLSKSAKSMYALKSKFSLSPEEMAKTYTYLATSDAVSEITGKYFDEKNRLVNSSKYSYIQDNVSKLMKLTMNYLGD